MHGNDVDPLDHISQTPVAEQKYKPEVVTKHAEQALPDKPEVNRADEVKNKQQGCSLKQDRIRDTQNTVIIKSLSKAQRWPLHSGANEIICSTAKNPMFGEH